MANDINSVVLAGRLTRDAELSQTKNGLSLLKFGLASTTGKDKTGFFDCTVFGKLADAVSKYMTKGKQVFIQGKLDFQQWEKDGQKRSKIAIIVNDLQMVGGRSEQAADSAPAAAQEEIPF
jgi:single-strand DNA-binding protein